MSTLRTRLLGLAALLAAAVGAGCASSESMTPQQREGVQLRRYCEQHHEDIAKCAGFLGDH
jgi:hypothetical protein